MRTEKEIREKRDFLKGILTCEDIELSNGEISKRKIMQKIQILDWVLDEEKERTTTIDFPKPLINYKGNLTIRGRIIKFLNENSGYFSSSEFRQSLNNNYSLQSIQKELREMSKDGLLIHKIREGVTGRPKVYKLK